MRNIQNEPACRFQSKFWMNEFTQQL